MHSRTILVLLNRQKFISYLVIRPTSRSAKITSTKEKYSRYLFSWARSRSTSSPCSTHHMELYVSMCEVLSQDFKTFVKISFHIKQRALRCLHIFSFNWTDRNWSPTCRSDVNQKCQELIIAVSHTKFSLKPIHELSIFHLHTRVMIIRLYAVLCQDINSLSFVKNCVPHIQSTRGEGD